MNVVVCGAGEIGSHAAESLAAAGHGVTVIDVDPAKLAAIGDSMDVATCEGNGADAIVLRRAGAADADLFIAATQQDEINLLAATVARGVGAAKSIARVHHAAYFEKVGLDYQAHLDIDRLICPEYSTALAIARRLSNPGAIAIENLARRRIEMQEFPVATTGPAIGRRLQDVSLPAGTRLALIRRKGAAFIPEATSVVAPGDSIILVGNAGAFETARALFIDEKRPKQRLFLMGGPPIAVWLCRALRDRAFSIRLFETDHARAEQLAEELDWITVIRADPTERAVFDDENLAQADVFIPLLDNDERNIIAGVLAKTRGVTTVIAVVQKSKYLDVLFDIGIDHAFSTRLVAGAEIDAVLDESPLRRLGTLAEGSVDVLQVRVGAGAPVAGRPLRDLKLSPDWVVAAIQRGPDASVPGADDRIDAGDVAIVVGRRGREATLEELFAAGA
jgi:trk system potassium uptake protein TrkA